MYKAYASAFTAYLLKTLNEPREIKNIILFGSSARGEATKDSDIDIFIEITGKNKKIENKINKALNEFYSSRESIQFKLLGIDNTINLIIGSLNKWKELKKSIESTGTILYGPYLSSDISGKKHLLMSWEAIGKNRGAFLNKIYGFKLQGKKYSGLLEKYYGKKIGKSSILIPVESKDEFFEVIKKYKINAEIIEVYY
ncbi:MAG: nucleotidyltransferase domain-containing protein [Nanoarchaeota archaeon]